MNKEVSFQIVSIGSNIDQVASMKNYTNALAAFTARAEFIAALTEATFASLEATTGRTSFTLAEVGTNAGLAIQSGDSKARRAAQEDVMDYIREQSAQVDAGLPGLFTSRKGVHGGVKRNIVPVAAESTDATDATVAA
jgi:hypothetical protein